jgi:hypothetical protein
MSMVKRVLGALAVFMALAMLLFVPIAGAVTTYTTTILVVNPYNQPVSSAPVYVYFLNGTQVTSGTTNSTGYVQFSLANGTYLVFVKGSHRYYFALIKVAGTTKAVINGTKLHYVNITSVPVTTSFTLKPDRSNVTISLNTNTTVFGDKNATIVFPSSFVSFPYEYKLSSVKNATTTVSTGTIFANMTGANQVVTATYTGSIAFTSPLFLAIIGVIVIVIIAGAWYAGTHAIYNASYRFVRRTGSETKRFVRSVNEEDKDRKHYVHRAD